MRKALLSFLSIIIFTSLQATSLSEIKPVFNANQIFLPVGKTGNRISLMELSKIPLKDLEKLANRKMAFFDRIAFNAGQKKLQKNLLPDGNFKKKKFEKTITKYFAGETGFHAGGFALGFFLLIIGVLIAYLVNDDYKRNRVKWAWTGFGISIAILTLVATLVGQSVY